MAQQPLLVLAARACHRLAGKVALQQAAVSRHCPCEGCHLLAFSGEQEASLCLQSLWATRSAALAGSQEALGIWAEATAVKGLAVTITTATPPCLRDAAKAFGVQKFEASQRSACLAAPLKAVTWFERSVIVIGSRTQVSNTFLTKALLGSMFLHGAMWAAD